jgi:uncharacterized membrane protein
MRTPASIAGHPIHPMLVPIAIGGFLLSFVFDIVCRVTGAVDPWLTVAYYTMVGGIVGALAAALFGFADMLSLHGPVKRTALTHMGLNLAVVALYIVNATMRHGAHEAASLPFILSIVAILLLVVSGWLGGKMVYEAGVGVNGVGEVAATPATSARERHI